MSLSGASTHLLSASVPGVQLVIIIMVHKRVHSGVYLQIIVEVFIEVLDFFMDSLRNREAE